MIGMRFAVRATALMLFSIGVSQNLYAQIAVDDPRAACARDHLKESAKADQFIFNSYKSEDDGSCLQVLQNSKVIFRRTVDSPQGFTIGQPADKESKVPAIANGTDITGRGHPDMIVSFYTGGAHCCLFDYVFELEPEFKLLATLDAEDSWPAYFVDLNGDDHYYYVAQDWTFAYWYGSFAGHPPQRAPRICGGCQQSARVSPCIG